MKPFRTVFCLFLLLLVPTISHSLAQTTPARGTEEVRSVAWSPDGTQLAIGSGYSTCDADAPEDYAIQVIEPETGGVLKRLNFHTCTVRSLEWDRFGEKLFSSAGIETGLNAVLWDVESAAMIHASPPYGGADYGYMTNITGRVMDKWSPGNSSLLSVFVGAQNIEISSPVGFSDNGGVFVGDAKEHTYAADWSANGRFVVTGHEGGTAIVWEKLHEYTPEVGRLETGESDVVSVIWGGDGSRIFTGTSDGKISIWNAETWMLEHTLEGHSGGITALSLAPNFQALASASENGTVRVWDVETGLEIERFSRPEAIYAVEWSPDGTRLAYGGEGNGEVEIVTVIHTAPPDFAPNPVAPTMRTDHIAWSPDGEFLAITGTPDECSPDDPR